MGPFTAARCGRIGRERPQGTRWNSARAQEIGSAAWSSNTRSPRQKAPARWPKVHLSTSPARRNWRTVAGPPAALLAQPEDVAKKIVRAVERNVDTLYVPGFWKLIMMVIKSIPSTVFKKAKPVTSRFCFCIDHFLFLLVSLIYVFFFGTGCVGYIVRKSLT